MANFGGRSGAFIRGLYANAQNPYQIQNMVKRTAAEAAVASSEQLQKRKRDENGGPGMGLLNQSPCGTFFGSGEGSRDCDPSSFFAFDMEGKSRLPNINSDFKRCRLGVEMLEPAVVQAQPHGHGPAEFSMGVRMGKRTVTERRKKNSRERIRRAGMSDKFKELYDLVCSGMVQSFIDLPLPSPEQSIPQAEGLKGQKVAKPSKVLVLSEAIKAIQTLGSELEELKRQNDELKRSKADSPFLMSGMDTQPTTNEFEFGITK